MKIKTYPLQFTEEYLREIEKKAKENREKSFKERTWQPCEKNLVLPQHSTGCFFVM